jgi:hypothetical protein
MTIVALFLINEMSNLGAVLKFTFLRQRENRFRFYIVLRSCSYKQNGMEAMLLRNGHPDVGPVGIGSMSPITIGSALLALFSF